MNTPPDDVDVLLSQLKALPLIDGADLDKPFAAYDAFELVLSAILRAALVQVPEAERKGKNRVLFERFVVERFPPGRGRGDEAYAKALWKLRCDFVKEKRTASFTVTHNNPQDHQGDDAQDGRKTLDLQSLIADFRAAVDNLGDDLRKLARVEVERRTVRMIPLGNTPSARAASGTGP